MTVRRLMTGPLSRVRIVLVEQKNARNNFSLAIIESELLSLHLFETINTGPILEYGKHVRLFLKLTFICSYKLILF
jgi:hypothetical protein